MHQAVKTLEWLVEEDSKRISVLLPPNSLTLRCRAWHWLQLCRFLADDCSCPTVLATGWKAGLHEKSCRTAEQTTPNCPSGNDQNSPPKGKIEGDFSNRQTLVVFAIPNYCFQHVLVGFWLEFILLPIPKAKKTQSRLFGMIRANTNKCFAGCSSPLLKYIGCTYVTYPFLSEVIISLEALLRLWHFVNQASKKFRSQTYYC